MYRLLDLFYRYLCRVIREYCGQYGGDNYYKCVSIFSGFLRFAGDTAPDETLRSLYYDLYEAVSSC